MKMPNKFEDFFAAPVSPKILIVDTNETFSVLKREDLSIVNKLLNSAMAKH